MNNSDSNRISDWLAEHEPQMIQTADFIFNHPELAYQEKMSSRCLADFLEKEGFQIEWNTAGIETAFTASWGSGKPVIGFLAEYDARKARTCLRSQSSWNRCHRGCLCP